MTTSTDCDQQIGYIEPLNGSNVTNMDSNTDCFEEMKTLRLKYPKNIIIVYININSIRNKFENLSQVIEDKLDVLIIAETKLDASFPTNRVTMSGFKAPFRARH